MTATISSSSRLPMGSHSKVNYFSHVDALLPNDEALSSSSFAIEETMKLFKTLDIDELTRDTQATLSDTPLVVKKRKRFRFKNILRFFGFGKKNPVPDKTKKMTKVEPVLPAQSTVAIASPTTGETQDQILGIMISKTQIMILELQGALMNRFMESEEQENLYAIDVKAQYLDEN